MFERVGVTGANGRLGRAVADSFATSGRRVFRWSRPDYDLDEPSSSAPLFERDQPDLIVHAAAWTDVDGCAREPDLALQRNSDAVGALARECYSMGAGLILISTNEVFSGARDDKRGYVEDDRAEPINAYGRSKLQGEVAARDAFAGVRAPLWIVRTSWLYGPPGNDFPAKIAAAAARLPLDEALPVVADEFGSPTYTVDLASALVRLVEAASPGTYHLAGEGVTSRAEWAKRVVAVRAPDRQIRKIRQRDFQRVSQPPPWGVLDTTKARSLGIHVRSWQDALDDYLLA